MVGFVNDSGKNVVAAMNKFDKVDIKLPCVAHRLNLCVGDLFRPKNITCKDEKYYIFEYTTKYQLRKTEIDPSLVDSIEKMNEIKAYFGTLIKKCKHLVGSFRSSENLTRRLKDKQQELAIGSERKLMQDVVTRWNSTYDMLRSILENKLPLKALRVNAIIYFKFLIKILLI